MPSFESADDRAAFLADFGDPVTGSASFTAIYDYEYVESENIAGNKPILTCPYLAPVTSLSKGDALTVNSTSYHFIRAEPDGTGWCTLILEEQ